jgi:hypothetical protein
MPVDKNLSTNNIFTEGDNYKTTSDKVRVKAKIFKLDHKK